MMLLKSALVTSLLTLLMRSRRKARGYAVNLFILAGIAIASLVSLSTVVVA